MKVATARKLASLLNEAAFKAVAEGKDEIEPGTLVDAAASEDDAARVELEAAIAKAESKQ